MKAQKIEKELREWTTSEDVDFTFRVVYESNIDNRMWINVQGDNCWCETFTIDKPADCEELCSNFFASVSRRWNKFNVVEDIRLASITNRADYKKAIEDKKIKKNMLHNLLIGMVNKAYTYAI